MSSVLSISKFIALLIIRICVCIWMQKDLSKQISSLSKYGQDESLPTKSHKMDHSLPSVYLFTHQNALFQVNAKLAGYHSGTFPISDHDYS